MSFRGINTTVIQICLLYTSQRVAQGAAKLFAIVDAPAEHQLTVDGDAALHQTGQVLQHLSLIHI